MSRVHLGQAKDRNFISRFFVMSGVVQPVIETQAFMTQHNFHIIVDFIFAFIYPVHQPMSNFTSICKAVFTKHFINTLRIYCTSWRGVALGIYPVGACQCLSRLPKHLHQQTFFPVQQTNNFREGSLTKLSINSLAILLPVAIFVVCIVFLPNSTWFISESQLLAT